VGEKLIRGKGF